MVGRYDGPYRSSSSKFATTGDVASSASARFRFSPIVKSFAAPRTCT